MGIREESPNGDSASKVFGRGSGESGRRRRSWADVYLGSGCCALCNSPRLNRLQDIGGDADGDPLGGFPDRVAGKICVTHGGFDPAVTEETADDRLSPRASAREAKLWRMS